LSHLFLRPKEDISQLPVFNLHVLIKMEWVSYNKQTSCAR
jgi:hypothetical protein